MSERQLRLALDGPPEPEAGGLPKATEIPAPPEEEIVSMSSTEPSMPDESAEPTAPTDLVLPQGGSETDRSVDLVAAGVQEALRELDQAAEGHVDDEHDGELAPIHEPTLWRDLGWTAEVIPNEDGEGWAVAMSRYGEAEPALIGPWVMGRDKKNPKPMNDYDFRTLVKAASDVMKRHEQQLRARLHRSVVVYGEAGRVAVTLDIVPDEDEPYALLAARDERGDLVAEERVSAAFQLNQASADQWVAAGFGDPR
jgi:hypothetical protein